MQSGTMVMRCVISKHTADTFIHTPMEACILKTCVAVLVPMDQVVPALLHRTSSVSCFGEVPSRTEENVPRYTDTLACRGDGRIHRGPFPCVSSSQLSCRGVCCLLWSVYRFHTWETRWALLRCATSWARVVGFRRSCRCVMSIGEVPDETITARSADVLTTLCFYVDEQWNAACARSRAEHISMKLLALVLI